MGHHHGHSCTPHRARNKRRLAVVLVLTALYMVAEVVGGWFSGSLALLADAGHMFSDAAALGLSLFAAWIAERPPTPTLSYGYYRAEILAALANAATLIAISIFVFIEAAGRLLAPEPVAGPLMMAVAAGGLCVNVAGLAMLHAGKSDSLNIHGAWLHLLTDALGSVAALLAAALIWRFGWSWADPVASILIGILVIYSAWDLLKESIAILMQSAPRRLDVDAVRNCLASVSGVCGVHDLHVWTITSGMESLSAHIVLAQSDSADAALAAIRQAVHQQFGIDHITIQIERQGAERCESAF